MRGTVLYGPRDVRFEERDAPKILNPTDAIIRLSATCVCGSDLWPYRGIQPIEQPTPMGPEYCGMVEEVGSEVDRRAPNWYEVGDVAYWSPSHDLAIYYHQDGESIPSPGIIPIAKIDGGAEAFNVPGSVKVVIELAE